MAVVFLIRGAVWAGCNEISIDDENPSEVTKAELIEMAELAKDFCHTAAPHMGSADENTMQNCVKILGDDWSTAEKLRCRIERNDEDDPHDDEYAGLLVCLSKKAPFEPASVWSEGMIGFENMKKTLCQFRSKNRREKINSATLVHRARIYLPEAFLGLKDTYQALLAAESKAKSD